jgi:hypothetical protein
VIVRARTALLAIVASAALVAACKAKPPEPQKEPKEDGVDV